MNTPLIHIKEKTFALYITESEITKCIDAIAQRMNKELAEANPLFVGVLNGSFMFAADLMKKITFPCNISFVKTSSYSGTQSRGKVDEVIGLNTNVKGRTIVILEDIIDTGNTIESLYNSLKNMQPAAIHIATLLLKPDIYNKKIEIGYTGKEISNNFIVGYGLDYDGYGRNLKDIYILN